MALVLAYEPTERQVFAALRTVLLQMLDTNVEVIKAQTNRVPEPKSADFVLMTPVETPRIGTNTNVFTDCVYTGSIAGNVLTITAFDPRFSGKLAPGYAVFGVGVLSGQSIVKQTSGTTGGIGTYQLSKPQTLSARTLASGTQALIQPAGLMVQLDVHGPNSETNAGRITTLFRDEVGTELFAATGTNVSPLHCDDPRQLPFVNEQDQMEDRFILTLNLEVDFRVVIPQQFAGEAIVSPIDATALPFN